MTAWRYVHAGDLVRGWDGRAYRVALRTGAGFGLIDALTGQPTYGTPDPDADANVIQASDTTHEQRAAAAFIAAGFTVEIIEERVSST